MQQMGMSAFSSLKDKRVLITGYTGFKGGWLSIWLDMIGARVAGLALDPTSEDGVFVRSGIGKKIREFRVDVRDLGAVKRTFSEVQPEIVFHLAAQPLVLDGYRLPAETFATNTLGTVHVLEAIRMVPSVQAVVMITSDKCYENRGWSYGYRETDGVGGHDPYSASKGAAELVISSYRRSYFSGQHLIGIASARAGNVIGGGDWSAHRLVPDIIRSIETDSVLDIRNPMSTRPWQHVLEPLGGYMGLACRLLNEPSEYSEAWNFGPPPNQMQPVKSLVEDLFAYFGRGRWRDVADPSQAHEDALLSLETSKAAHRLGWQSVLDYEQTIEFTAKWYAEYRDRDGLELCREQIGQYVNLWKSREES
jgi:CDP-glucose 4,6-dehydratase